MIRLPAPSSVSSLSAVRLEQGVHDLAVFLFHGLLQGGPIDPPLHRQVDVLFDQRPDAGQVAGDDRGMQVLGGLVGLDAPGRLEQCDHRGVAILDRAAERRPSFPIAGIDVDAELDQGLRRIQIPLLGGFHQGILADRLHVVDVGPAVDQGADHGRAAGLGREGQCRR